MKYSGNCLCGEVSFKFPYDPMMQFKCHCNVCQKVFGNTLHALAMPQDELEISGSLSNYYITGGSMEIGNAATSASPIVRVHSNC